MRFLFTTIPGFGHFQPIVPLARALVRAGHSVAIASAASFAGAIERSGLQAITAGLDWDESRLLETLPDIVDEQEEYQGEWLMRRIFLDRSPRAMIPDLLKVIAKWQPDVIVSGTYELGGPLAAEIAGIPFASCSISFRWNRWMLKRVMGKAVTTLRRDFRVLADPQFTAFGRHLDLCLVPRTWVLEEALLRPPLTRLVWGKIFASQTPLRQRLVGLKAQVLRQLLAVDHLLHPAHAFIGANTHHIRQHGAVKACMPPPAWLSRLPHSVTVYVSLGTVFAQQYPEVFAAILRGLSAEPVNLILTVGTSVDPRSFGPQPDHVRIEQYIEPEELDIMLPHVDLCVCHAGYGTVTAALRHGIPLVFLPLSADQPVITQMCLFNQVGPELPSDLCRLSAKGLPVIRPERITPAVVRHLVRLVLEDPSYRRAARKMQSLLATTPGPERGVELLEKLAAQAKPHAAQHSS